MKKFVAAITAVFFAVALVLVGAATPASAHTATLNATVTCNNAAGTAVVTWTIDNDFNEQLNVTASNNSSIPVGTTVAATGGAGHADTTKTFTQNISAPAAGKTASATVSFRWDGDNFTQNGTAQSIAVPPSCGIKTTPTPTPTPTATQDPKDASATLTDTPATCTSAEKVAEGALSHATWQSAISYSGTGNNTYTAVAVAESGHLFANGVGVSANNKSKTFTGRLTGQQTTGCAPAKSYVIVAWTMPSWVNSTTPTWSQHYFTSAPETTPDLNALDKYLTLTCGTYYQVDIYNNSDVTTSLIHGGYLNSPNSPAEDLIPGGWGTAYKLVKSPDCAPPTPKDADATVTFNPPTCGADGTLASHTATNATFVGDAPVINNGQWSWVVNAASGHLFADGSSTKTLSGTVPAALPWQSTNANGDCYIAPPSPKDASATVTFAPGTCGVAGAYASNTVNHATFEGATPTISADGATWSWVVDAESGHRFSDGSTTETLSGPVPAAIPFQNTNPNGQCYQEPPADASASVTFSDGTCTAVGSTPTATIHNATWTKQDTNTVAGSYDWIATATPGHEFAAGQFTLELQGNLPVQIPSQSTNPNGICYVAPPADASAAITVSAPTCDAPSMLMYGAHVNSTFDTVHSTADGATGATDSTYTVYADADSGHAFNPAGAGTGESFNQDAVNQPANTIETFTGTLAPQLATQSDNPNAPCFDAPPIALTDPTASVCKQSTETALTSWVHIAGAAHVTYQIFPTGNPAAETVLNAGYTSEAAGTYTIVADADAGFTLAATATEPAGVEHTWSVSVADSASPECTQLPVGATWHAGASATNAVCTSGDVQRGTILLTHLASETGRVNYTVTNEATNAVVYHGSSRTSVSVAPGTYDVTAQAVASADGISGPDTFNGLVVAAAVAGCSSLSSLAFTGESAAVGIYLAGGLLFLGIAGLFMRRRFGRRAHQ